MLSVRKLADTSSGARVPGYHPMTGERHLINPETGAAEPWPLTGIRIEGDVPDAGRLPTSFVENGVSEGWIELVNPRAVHRPGGPAGARQWSTTHTFTHADAIVIKTVDGDVRYAVTHQPDKYADSDDPAELVTPEVYEAGRTRVDHFYGVEREG